MEDFIKKELDKDKLTEDLALKEVIYGTHNILNALIEILCERKIITMDELEGKLDEPLNQLNDSE